MESNHSLLEPAEEPRVNNLTVTPDQLYGMARGFSCIFWAIPLGLMLASGSLDLRLLSRIKLPAYFLGLGILYLGFVMLYKIRPPTASWVRRVRHGFFALFLQAYFIPFVFWWARAPQEAFFTWNVAIMFLGILWLLIIINRLAGEAALAIRDENFFIETRLCTWSILLFIVAPFMLLILIAAVASIRYTSNFLLEIISLHQRLNYWIFVLYLLPFTLTMGTSWKVKEICFKALKRSAKVPSQGPDVLRV